MANKIKINRIKSGRISSRGAMSTRGGKRPATLAERRRRKRWVIVLVSFALVIASGFGLSRFSFSPQVSLSAVHVRGASLIPESEIKKIVEKQTATAFLGVLSRNNLLLAPRENIEADIKNLFKTIEFAEVSFNSPHDLVVSVRERVPAALWCGDSDGSGDVAVSAANVAADAAQKCFYLDKTGYIFSEAPVFGGDVFIMWNGFLKTPEDSTTPVGQHIMPQVSFEKLNSFVKDVAKLGLKTVSIVEISESELELHLANGGVIVVNRKMSYEQTLQNIESIVAAKQVEFRGSFIDRVEKVDVRFSGKAFVKLKN
ncbi:MAG: hypothetical protein AAB726_01245 [Patescibacteria group bacterium]